MGTNLYLLVEAHLLVDVNLLVDLYLIKRKKVVYLEYSIEQYQSNDRLRERDFIGYRMRDDVRTARGA